MRKKYFHKFINALILFVVITFLAACKKSQNIDSHTPPTQPSDTSVIFKVFGFDHQQKYAYCPSVIINGNERHIWFCGTEPAGVFSDHIYYVRGDLPYSSRIPKIVLAPGPPGSWDDRHVCDPSVIKGEFLFKGITYKYAMFYLGNRQNRYYNEIGVAFAQTMDSDDWIKYPTQLVEKTWEGENDLPLGNGKAWGVGQPSAFSLDGKGKVMLTYTVGDALGTRVVLRNVDLSDLNIPQLSAPLTVSTVGLTKLDYSINNIILLNADFAFNENRSMIYMTSQVLPNPISYPAFVGAAIDLNKMPYNDFINGTGTWKLIQRIGPAESGYPRNHNSGIGRDAFGAIPDINNAEHYFTTSKAEPDVEPSQNNFAEWTYQIYVMKSIDLTK